MTKELEAQFDKAMHNVYREASSNCNYHATRFLKLVGSHGGISAARQLLRSPRHSNGLTRLWECGCLDISMEALVLKEKWNALFSDDERRIARKRLQDLGYP